MNHPDSPGGPTITLLKHIMRPDACEPVTLASALHQIRSGRWKAEVEAIRSFDEAGDKQSAAEAKGQLPCFLFAGRFERANDNGLVSHSGLAVLDIDNLDPAKLAEIRRQAVGQAWVAATFTSPRGRGLKLVCRIGEQDSEGHKRTADALRGHCATLFNVEIDRGAEVSRKCFASFDPDCHINPSSMIWCSGGGESQITEEGRIGRIGELEVVPLPLLLPHGDALFPSPERLESLLTEWDLVPRRQHDTHSRLFKLAQLGVALRDELRRALTDSEESQLFQAWYSSALRVDPSFVWRERAEYLLEFRSMRGVAYSPLGQDAVCKAVQLARQTPLPKAALSPDFSDSPTVQMLIAICFQLSVANQATGIFFLSARTAGRCLDRSADHAANLLRGLVASRVLTVAEKAIMGPNGRAARYRWIGSV